MCTRSGRTGAYVAGAVLVAVMLTVSGVVLAGDDVPLKGTGTATFLYHDYTTQTSHFTITGNSTHLGLVSGSAAVLFEYEPVPHPVSAVVHMVAADGATLDLATTMASQSYVIIGGSGRFDGAIGSGLFVATGAGEVSLEWDGTIDFKKP